MTMKRTAMLVAILWVGICADSHAQYLFGFFPYANIATSNLDPADASPQVLWGGATQTFWSSRVEVATENVIWGRHKTFYTLDGEDSETVDRSIYDIKGDRGFSLEFFNTSEFDYNFSIYFQDSATELPFHDDADWPGTSTPLVNQYPDDPDCDGDITLTAVGESIEGPGGFDFIKYQLLLPAHMNTTLDWTTFFNPVSVAGGANLTPAIVVIGIPGFGADPTPADTPVVQIHGREASHARWFATDGDPIDVPNTGVQDVDDTATHPYIVPSANSVCPPINIFDFSEWLEESETEVPHFYHRLVFPNVVEKRARALEQGNPGDVSAEATLIYVMNGDPNNSDKFRIVLRRPNGEVINDQFVAEGEGEGEPEGPQHYTFETDTIPVYGKFKFSPSQFLKADDLPCAEGDFNLTGTCGESCAEGEGECPGTCEYPGQRIPEFRGSVEIWGNAPAATALLVRFVNTSREIDVADLDAEGENEDQFTKYVSSVYCAPSYIR